MSDDSTRTDEEQRLAAQMDLFEAVSNAYGFIHGEEQVRALAATTFGDLLDDRIAEIRGPHPYGLPSRMEEIDKIKEDFSVVIGRLREEEESRNA